MQVIVDGGCAFKEELLVLHVVVADEAPYDLKAGADDIQDERITLAQLHIKRQGFIYPLHDCLQVRDDVQYAIIDP